MNVGSRIRELCNERDGNVATMERTLKLANGYVYAITKKGSTPSASNLRKIADYLGVTPDFLLGNDTGESSSDGVLIPIIGKVAAGIPITAVENVIGQEEISKKMASSGEYFALKIKGDSMSPYIMDGDIVIVRQQEDAETDEIVVAIVDGRDGVCKKLKKTKDAVMLVSLNPSYDPMIFTTAEVDSLPVRIIGKVEEIRRTVK